MASKKHDKSSARRRQSIRARLNHELEAAGVSCFTLYTDDVWQPGNQIPHEVDPHLYYPECMHSGPLARHEFRGTGEMSSHDDLSLRAQWVHDATKLPGVGADSCPPRYREDAEVRPLFSGFVTREAVRSTAIIEPYQPVLRSLFPDRELEEKEVRLQPEMLFFNFRSVQAFETGHRRQLLLLARSIFNLLADDLVFRAKHTWHDGFLMTLRAQSRLHRIVRDDFLSQFQRSTGVVPACASARTTANRQDLLHDFAKAFREELRKPQERMIVSIYEIRSRPDLTGLHEWNVVDDPEPRLVCRGSDGREKPNLDLQTLFDSSQASITVCTAVTGRSHLLQYVEQDSRHEPGHCTRNTAITLSDFLTVGGAWSAALDAESPSSGSGKQDAFDKLIGKFNAILSQRAPSGSAKFTRCSHTQCPKCRVLASGEIGNDVWEAMRDYLACWHIGRAVVDKWAARHKAKYARIFGALDKGDWQWPCSEVCVPIVIGNQVLGCVNIESNEIDRFNPSFLNALMSLAATVGVAIIQERTQRLLDTMQECAAAVHRVDSGAPARQLPLDKLAATAALAVGSTRLDIVGSNQEQGADALGVIAVSDPEWHERMHWRGPRSSLRGESGWSELIAKDPEAEGAVIALSYSADLSEPKAYPFHIRRRGEELTLEPVDIANTPILASGHAHDKPEMIVGLRLTEAASGEGTPMPAVMWCIYQHQPFQPPTCDGDGAPKREVVKRSRYLERLLAVARTCSLVPTIAQSDLLIAEDIRHNYDHAPLKHGLEYSAGWLNSALETNPHESVATVSAWLRLSHLAITALSWERDAAEWIRKARHKPLSESVIITEPYFSLRNLIDKVWQAALAVHGRDTWTDRCSVHGDEECLDGMVVRCDEKLVGFVFLQLFRNAIHAINERNDHQLMEAGKWVDVEATRVDDRVRIQLRDWGGGFPDDVLKALGRKSLRTAIVAHHGRGVQMVTRLLQAVCPERSPFPRNWFEADRGVRMGAEWEFWLPAEFDRRST